jgi:hypothetical protein
MRILFFQKKNYKKREKKICVMTGRCQSHKKYFTIKKSPFLIDEFHIRTLVHRWTSRYIINVIMWLKCYQTLEARP